MIAGLRPLIRALDRHIAQVAATIPQAQLLGTIAGIGPQRALVICAEALADHALSHAGPSRELRRAWCRQSKQSGERAVRHGTIPAGRESLAARRARAGRRLARAARAGQLAHALLPRAEGPRRLAHGARRRGAEAGARHPRDAAHEFVLDE